MASDNNRRVELRLSLTHGGLRGTPEHIETLRLRQREADQLAATGRAGAFDRLMAAAPGAKLATPAAAEKRRLLAPSPRPGRRPGGARVTAGLDDDDFYDGPGEGPADDDPSEPFLVRA